MSDNSAGALDTRRREFFEAVAAAGLYPPDMDYRAALTLQFVSKKTGMQP